MGWWGREAAPFRGLRAMSIRVSRMLILRKGLSDAGERLVRGQRPRAEELLETRERARLQLADALPRDAELAPDLLAPTS